MPTTYTEFPGYKPDKSTGITPEIRCTFRIGRARERAIITALGWTGGDLLTFTADAGVVTARRDPGGMVTLPASAHQRHASLLPPEIYSDCTHQAVVEAGAMDEAGTAPLGAVSVSCSPHPLNEISDLVLLAVNSERTGRSRASSVTYSTSFPGAGSWPPDASPCTPSTRWPAMVAGAVEVTVPCFIASSLATEDSVIPPVTAA
jgi:hypothetical protein